MATLEELEARLGALETVVGNIRSCTCDPTKYASADDYASMKKKMQVLEDAVGGLVNAPEYKLPMTAAELVEKLGKIE